MAVSVYLYISSWNISPSWTYVIFLWLDQGSSATWLCTVAIFPSGNAFAVLCFHSLWLCWDGHAHSDALWLLCGRLSAFLCALKASWTSTSVLKKSWPFGSVGSSLKLCIHLLLSPSLLWCQYHLQTLLQYLPAPKTHLFQWVCQWAWGYWLPVLDGISLLHFHLIHPITHTHTHTDTHILYCVEDPICWGQSKGLFHLPPPPAIIILFVSIGVLWVSKATYWLSNCIRLYLKVKISQSCLTLCDPMD